LNRRAIRAIVRKDLKVTMQNKGVVIPLLLVPLIMFVALPSLVGLMPLLGNIPDSDLAEIQLLISRMPPTLQAELAGYTPLQLLVVMMIVYYLAPMYLIVPMMVASVIAADSFAGEKERKTLEALLYTPTTDQELLLGKLLAAWLPAVGVALAGFVCYSVVANAVAGPIMGGIFCPSDRRARSGRHHSRLITCPGVPGCLPDGRTGCLAPARPDDQPGHRGDVPQHRARLSPRCRRLAPGWSSPLVGWSLVSTYRTLRSPLSDRSNGHGLPT
jgi:hypothetical protein